MDISSLRGDLVMDKMEWIKDLVLEEQEKEAQGLIDINFDIHTAASVEKATIQFLREIKNLFGEAAQAYNALRRDASSQIKIYGVSNTICDFMLFRNNVQLIFSLNNPGIIQIYSTQLNTTIVRDPQTATASTQALVNTIKAKWGAFDLQWTYEGKSFNIDSLVKYYFSLFIHLSSNH